MSSILIRRLFASLCSLLFLLVFEGGLAAQTFLYTMQPGATVWDNTTANWLNPSGQLVPYANASSVHAVINGPVNVGLTDPRIFGNLTLNNGVNLTASPNAYLQVFLGGVIKGGSTSNSTITAAIFPDASVGRVLSLRGDLTVNGPINMSGYDVVADDGTVVLAGAGRINATIFQIGGGFTTANSFETRAGAEVNTLSDILVAPVKYHSSFVNAADSAFRVGRNFIFGKVGTCHSIFNNCLIDVQGVMQIAPELHGPEYPYQSVRATFRHCTLVLGDSGGAAALSGEYSAFGNPSSPLPTLTFPGSRLKTRAGRTMTVSNSGNDLSIVVDGTIIDTTDGGAFLNAVLFGGALIKEGPGILKLGTRTSYNGASILGGLDGTIVRGGLIEFSNSESLNDGGSLLGPQFYNNQITGIKNIQLNGGGLRWAPGNTTDITHRLRLLNNFSFDTNGNNVSFGTALVGTGGMTKLGAGTLSLTVPNSFTGGTLIKGGTVEFSALNAFSNGTVSLDGGGLRWASGSGADILPRLQPIGAGGGTLDTNGNEVVLGAAPLTGAGALTKIGAGTLTLYGTHPYSGDLTVEGGALTLSGSFPNPAHLTIGRGSSAVLNVGDSGSSVSVQGNVSLGDTSAGSGTAHVFGSGTVLSAGVKLSVGNAGQGNLNIDQGGRVQSTGISAIAAQAGSTGTITVDMSSTLACGTDLQVGAGGNGTLNIMGGSATSGQSTALGILAGSVGSAYVAGGGAITASPGSLEVGGTLYVGYLGTGHLMVDYFGTVTAGNVVLGVDTGSSGTMLMYPGSTLNVGGTNGISRGNGLMSFTLAGATLKVTGSALTSSVPITLSDFPVIDTNGLSCALSGTLSGTGALIKNGAGTLTLTASNTYTGGTVVNGGEIVVNAATALGTGPVSIQQGQVSSTTAFSRDTSVSVIGSASMLSAASFIQIGPGGTGSLSVAGGGQVSTASSIAFGVLDAAQGTADISGTGSSLTVGSTCFIGYLGRGGVAVGAGGSVVLGGQMILASETAGIGSFDLNPGGTLGIGGLNGILKGLGTSTFNFNGGLLKVTGSSLSSSMPMTVSGNCTVDTNGLNATLSGTLTGTGNLTKTGTGVLAITSANMLTGSTGILAGTLGIATPTSLGSQSLFLNGGTLDLSFNGTATVQTLLFDGVPQVSGIWGGLTSTAPNKTSRITGPGLLQVLSSFPTPTFNPAATAGLSYDRGQSAIDLAATTGATPSGGIFSGPGVSNGFFDPTSAGYGLHTLTYTANNLSATFTIAVAGGLTLDETASSFAPSNLAPSGTAFAKEVFQGFGNYTIPHLNDGLYGNSFSWIGTTVNTFAGVKFASPVAVNRIAFSRDNTGAFTDRCEDFYTLQYSTDADPESPSATWITLGALDYRPGGSTGITQPARRHLFSFPSVTLTGMRIVCATPGTAMDEIELYPATGLFASAGMALLQEGGGMAVGNLALAPQSTAFSKDEIGLPPHATGNLNNGTFGNESSWIGGSANSFVGIALSGSLTVDRIAFGRDHTGIITDRALGRYTLQYTTVASPNTTTPDASWTTIGILDYQSAGGSKFTTPSLRHLYGFPAVTATGIRLIAPNGAAIDELELYLAAPYLKLQQPDTSVVANAGTVDFGARFPAEATQKTFTITNAGTSTLTLGALGLEGTTAGDFTASAINVSTLEPGASTTFIIAYNVGAAGPHSATVLLPSNGSSGSVASFTVIGSSLVPTFNPATMSGLNLALSSGLVNLSTITEASPAGGTFSGPGVTGNNFDPDTAGFGNHTLSYSYGGASASFTISVTGGLTLVSEGGSFAPYNLAPGGTAFAKEVFQGFGFYTIPHLNDGLYGEPNSWIGTTTNTFAGINLGATPVPVNRLAFSRDNQGILTDRSVDFYIIQYTTTPNPNETTTAWTNIGAIDYRSPSIGNSALRHLFSFPTVNATGLRIITATPGTAIDEIELYSPYTPQELWRQQYFGSTANTGNAADAFDFDKDGLANFVEYAFGLNPTTASSLPAAVTTANTLSYTFTANAPGITYGAETSTDLINWTPLSDTGTGGQHVFGVTTTGQSRLFIRLNVQ